jgi:hypothetical protein
MPSAPTEIRFAGASPHPDRDQGPGRHPTEREGTAAARVSAAIALLDRGWGKVPKPIAGGETGPPQPIRRIERIIVHPRNADRQHLNGSAVRRMGRAKRYPSIFRLCGKVNWGVCPRFRTSIV